MMNRREFVSGATAFAGSTLGLQSLGSAAPVVQSDPFARPFLPTTSWAYDLVMQLAQSGLHHGCPDGTFSGRAPASRGQFAWAHRAIFSQLPYCEGAGANLPFSRSASMPRVVRTLSNELLYEFAEQRISKPVVQSALARFERLWRSSLPRGVSDPMPLPASAYADDPLWPENWRARAEGGRLARQEWMQGIVCLYQAEPSPEETHTPNAIPLVSLPASGTDPYAAQVLLGHNAEMWRLLRRLGPPSHSRFGWLKDLFRLRATWSHSGRTAVALRRGRTYFSPDGLFRFNGTRFEPSDRPVRSQIRCDATDLEYLQRNQCLNGAFALMWGEPGTGVAYLRCHGPKGARNPARLFVIDLRAEIILNASVA